MQQIEDAFPGRSAKSKIISNYWIATKIVDSTA